jgi:predicted nucleic acid-binding protein
VKYEIEDFQRISNFVSKFKKIIITPHILTELSNLSFNITEPKLSSYLQKFVRVLKNFHEESLDKNTILKLDLFAKLGVTDSAFIEIAKDKKYLVITDDLDAYANMLKLRIDAINYSHFKYLLNETR